MTTSDSARGGSEVEVWSQATELLKQFGNNAEREAAGLAIDNEVARPQIVEAIGELRRAINNTDRRPALHFEFVWAFNVTGQEFVIDEKSRNIGKDSNVGGLAALPVRGPLVVLKAKTMNDAFADANGIWANRGDYKSWPWPIGYRVFNEVGSILFCFQLDGERLWIAPNETTRRIHRADSPIVYHDGQVWFSEPVGVADGTSYFGGKLAVSVEPLMSAPHLRRTITLDLQFFNLEGRGLRTLPLIFPQTLDGGKIEYEFAGQNSIRIANIRGKPSNKWPYRNYPAEFPPVALAFSKPERCVYEQFVGGLAQWPHPDARDKMIAVLPPTEKAGKFGVGVWSPLTKPSPYVWSVFEIDPNTWRVKAYNMCD